MEKPSAETIEEICGYIRAGAAFDVAVLAAGINDRDGLTIYKNLSNPPDGFWIEFADAVKKALAQFEILQIQRILQEGGAGGAKWLLEKSLPKKWGKNADPKMIGGIDENRNYRKPKKIR